MNIYYRRTDVFCTGLWKDEIDYSYVEYSTSKRKFRKKIFLESDVSLSMKERENLVKSFLKVKKINLIKA